MRRCIVDPKMANELKTLLKDDQGKIRLRYSQDADQKTGSTGVLSQLTDEDVANTDTIAPGNIYSQRLVNAYHYFSTTLAATPQNQKFYAERMLETIQFELHTIEEWQALVVFEQLNNRGKQLSLMELLKNRLLYLASRMCKPELAETVNRTWAEVYQNLGKFDSAADSSGENAELDEEFLRDHWIMKWGRKRDIADALKHSILEKTFTVRRLPRTQAASENAANVNGQQQNYYFEIAEIIQPVRTAKRLLLLFRNNEDLEKYFHELNNNMERLSPRERSAKLGEADPQELKSWLVAGLNRAIDDRELSMNVDPENTASEDAAQGPVGRRQYLEKEITRDYEYDYVSAFNTKSLEPEEITGYCKELSESIVCWRAVRQVVDWRDVFSADVIKACGSKLTIISEWLSRIRLLGRSDATPLLLLALLRVRRVPELKTFDETIRLLKTIERMAVLSTLAGFKTKKDSLQALAHKLYKGDCVIERVCDEIDCLLGIPKGFHEKFLESNKKRSEKSGFYGAPCIHYVLYEYEYELSRGRNQVLGVGTGYGGETDIGTSGLWIEHVLPQKVGLSQSPGNAQDKAAWPLFFVEALDDKSRRQCLHSIGNLFLVNDTLNRAVGANDYGAKRESFENATGCFGAQEIAQKWKSWGPESIRDRGLMILNFIEIRWKVYLGSVVDKLSLLCLPLGDLATVDQGKSLAEKATAMDLGASPLQSLSTLRQFNDTLTAKLPATAPTLVEFLRIYETEPWRLVHAEDVGKNGDVCALLCQDILVAVLAGDRQALEKMFPHTFPAQWAGYWNQLGQLEKAILEISFERCISNVNGIVTALREKRLSAEPATIVNTRGTFTERLRESANSFYRLQNGGDPGPIERYNFVVEHAPAALRELLCNAIT